MRPLRAKVDPLVGIKENIIIGINVPAGTDMKRYKNVDAAKNIPDQGMAMQLEDFTTGQEQEL